MQLSLALLVNAPVPDVFGVFADFQNAARRIADIKKIEFLTPQQSGVGARFKETRLMFGRLAAEEFLVSAFNEPSGYTLVCVSGGIEMTTNFTFESAEGGTRVCVEMSTKAINRFGKIFKPLGMLMKGMMRKCMERDMAALKACVEGRPADAAP